MGLPLGSPVAKLSCEAATEENAKRRSFMPRTQVTGKANFSPGITSGLAVTRAQHRIDSRLRVDHQARSGASIAGSPIIKGPAPLATYCAHSATSLV